MDYNTMSAYYNKASKELENEDRKAVKAIADTALSSLNEGISNNTSNYDSAVKNAYAQAQTLLPTDIDTIRYGVNSNAQNIDRTLTRNRDNVNNNLRTLKDVTEAKNSINEAKIGSNYGGDRAKITYDIAKKQDEANKLAEQEEQTRLAQEGYLDELNAISKANGYNYDFDSDIFNLKTQGYKDSDWQIMFLKEAKRLQSANKKATSTSTTTSSTRGNGKGLEAPALEEENLPLTDAPSGNSQAYEQLNERIGKYLMSASGSTQRANLVSVVEKNFNDGNITEDEANKLINLIVPKPDTTALEHLNERIAKY